MSSGGLDVFVKKGLVVLNVELMVSNVVIRFSGKLCLIIRPCRSVTEKGKNQDLRFQDPS